MGGEIQGLLAPRNDAERKEALELGYDLDRVLTTNDLVTGNNCFFAATGITDGLLFDGVKFEKDCTRTSSLVISTLDNTARFTTTVHIKDGAQSIALR